jgi:hypothetical protein
VLEVLGNPSFIIFFSLLEEIQHDHRYHARAFPEIKNMHRAISGTHFNGKSTLIEDFIKAHPNYQYEPEPYDQLQDEGAMELSLEPSFSNLVVQLNFSIGRLNKLANEKDIIFDRCPIDFIAYAMCLAEQGTFDIHDTEVAEKFSEVTEALNNIDLIVFLPIDKENPIEYTEENPIFRKRADKYFRKIYRDDLFDIFPKYNHPRIIELSGDRITRMKKLENHLSY